MGCVGNKYYVNTFTSHTSYRLHVYPQLLSVSIQIYPSTNMPKEKPLRAVASENYLLNTNALVQLQVSMISNVMVI